jgi:hypothetical protein
MSPPYDYAGTALHIYPIEKRKPLSVRGICAVILGK